MNRDLEHSFKARLRNIAKERRITAAELWETLVLERFLVRVAKSRFSSNFILKGGMLLSTYINIGRHTQDLDFLVQSFSNHTEDLIPALKEIISIKSDDGFRFSDLSLRPLSHPHMKYPGARAQMMAYFGKTRFKVIVDLGYGDIVHPTKRQHPLITGSKGPLFESHVNIFCYPQEFIAAEKLEAVVFHGTRNSRMKDFHDLYKLMQTQDLQTETLENVIRAVFQHRNTEMKLPILFAEGDNQRLQELWNNHLKGLASVHDLPTSFSNMVEKINTWLQKHTSLCI